MGYVQENTSSVASVRNNMEIIPLKTRKIKPEDDLIEVLTDGLHTAKISLQSGDIVAIVSKIVALTEGGLVDVRGKNTSKKSRYGAYKDSSALLKYIESETDIGFDDDMFLTIKNNIFTPSAGVDTSNVSEGYAIGWPKDSYKSADTLRKKILLNYEMSNAKLKNLGILIFDSCIIPLRNGVTGIALGYSGFQGVEDYRGKKDLFGNILRVTQKNIADGLAAAATVVCGEGRESIPFVIIRGAPAKSVLRVSRTEMTREPKDCLYRALYAKKLLSKKKIKK